MATERKYFGTDGIRGPVGTYPITAEFMLKLGWAAGRVLGRKGHASVVIGKDTRISGYMFESALEAGLSAAGVDIILLGPMPTPAVAYLTRTLHAQAGIVISASHNPFYDNGIKFFSDAGKKLPDEVEVAIEAEMEKEMETVVSRELGKVERLHAEGRYIEFCKSTYPMGEDLRGYKVVVDCAHGATYQVAPSVFDELGADVVPIGVSPDGLNINESHGAVHPERMSAEVVRQGADLGIAFDGDGDRVIMVDQEGEIVDGDELLFIIAEAKHRAGTLKRNVVGTLMSNLGLELALAERDIPLQRAKVGDRYIMRMLEETGSNLGGEGSGHIICLDRTTTGDGIVSALQVLAAMRQSGQSLHALKKGMAKYPQTLVNVRLHKQVDVTALPAVSAAVRDAEKELAEHGRVLLRPSGTEPLVRVMVEGRDRPQVEDVAKRIARVVEEALASEAE
ncbi:MAG: phosphoglucosamine mutase [Gammaproteobacteria bacterium]|nr:phosphoglucosamine mutase [Gammaproteobacteria bacterium]